MGNLRSEIKSRQDESDYLFNLFGEYIRNFESRLHIAEIQRYQEAIETAKLARKTAIYPNRRFQNPGATPGNLARPFGGFAGRDPLRGHRGRLKWISQAGDVRDGWSVRSIPLGGWENCRKHRAALGSLEPAIVSYGAPIDASAAAEFITVASGLYPLDPTLGSAHKVEETHETLMEHIRKGGPVMYPIFVLAGAALLVALYKWLGMAFIFTPSAKRLRDLLAIVARHDRKAALLKARKIGGPVGKMLVAGIEHLREPRDLIEEVMYEKILATRLKIERFLPFISISAASAPLLGLLGTVTGIINTFKLITVFGSGDVKTLSGGISEALITTEFGLIVAIPSLLIHAFLSRKARGVINQMEKAAVALVNQVSKTPYQDTGISEGKGPSDQSPEPRPKAAKAPIEQPIAT